MHNTNAQVPKQMKINKLHGLMSSFMPKQLFSSSFLCWPQFASWCTRLKHTQSSSFQFSIHPQFPWGLISLLNPIFAEVSYIDFVLPMWLDIGVGGHVCRHNVLWYLVITHWVSQEKIFYKNPKNYHKVKSLVVGYIGIKSILSNPSTSCFYLPHKGQNHYVMTHLLKT
jgi:hypothetical protein